jgi:hypothetical protein
MPGQPLAIPSSHARCATRPCMPWRPRADTQRVSRPSPRSRRSATAKVAGVRGSVPLVLALASLSGCAAAKERAQVGDRFRGIFACPDPVVSSEDGGYVAQGCGATAHFRCFDSDRGLAEDVVEGPFLRSILSESLEGDVCVLERSERPGDRSATAGVERRTTERGVVLLKAYAFLSGGHLEALAAPSQTAEHAMISVHRVRALGPEPCNAQLTQDGSRVELLHVRRAGDHEVRFGVSVRELGGLHGAQQVSGSACGYEFTLDDQGKKVLALFAARVRDELAQAPRAASSGGEASERAAPAP